MRSALALCIALLTSTPLLAAGGTNVSGAIAANTTWTTTGSPYTVTGTVTVNATKTLTIQAGVTVKFNTGTSLVVNGILSAVGTSSKKIIFTSSAATPAPGNWGRIELQSSDAASQVTFATISYGGNGGYEVRLISGTMNFNNVTVSQSSTIGIQSSTPSAITLATITVSNCANDGVYLTNSGVHALSGGSVLTANGVYGLHLGSGGSASIASTSFTNNTSYAIGLDAGSSLGAISGLTATGNGGGAKNAIEYRGGTVGAHDETWRASTLPYIISGGVTVNSGRTLTIEPGFTGKFAANTNLTINGKLSAVGTSASLITLTSSAATPARGGWSYLMVQSSDPASQLTYATISYGGGAGYAVRVNAGVMNFDHVTVTQSAGTGIQSDTAGAITLSAVTISNCASDGLYVSTVSGALGGLHTITGSTFSANAGYGANLGTNGNAKISTSTFTDNTNYAIGLDATSFLGPLATLTATGNGGGAKNAIEHRGGSLGTHDETWSASSLPYVITGGITVPVGRTLTVEPGFTGKFNALTDLTINGRLASVGTSASPITLTTSAATPSRGAWSGIQINTTDPASQISYTTVAYAGTNGYALRILAGSLTADHLTTSDSSGDGILTSTMGTVTLDTTTATNCTSHGMEVADYSGTPGQSTITNSTFTNNGSFGLFVGDRGRVTVSQSTFTGNTSGGLGSTTTSPDARLCYWGSNSGPSGSGFGTGQSVTSLVMFEPWLTAAPSTAQRITSLTLKNRTFNPNLPSSAKVTALTNNSGSWTLNIINGASSTIRTLTGSGAITDVAWDGKDTNGILQANGNYTYELQSVNGANSATPARGRMIIDTTKQLTLTGYTGSPAFFSPNGDAVQDTTTLAGTASYDDVTWTLTIRDVNSVAVRTVTGTNPVSYVWDGRNNASVLQPDGAYTATMVIVDGNSTANAAATVTIDTTSPTASITAPASTVLSNVYQNGVTDIAINGTASDSNLTNWTLDYSTGGSYTVFASGAASITNALLYTWPTLAYTNGVYTVRLRATDQAGNLTTATISPTLSNFSVTTSPYAEFSPGANQTYSYTSIVPFTLTETLTIRDQTGALVRTLVNAQRSAGTFGDAWNGRNDGNALLPDGPYSYTATVTDGTHTYTWDQSSMMRNTVDPAHAAVYPAVQPTFDPFNNNPIRTSYTLGGTQRIALEVGPTNVGYGQDCAQVLHDYGTVCVNPWIYQSSGSHNLSWWGTNGDGSFIPGMAGLNIIVRDDNFPKNVVLTFGTAPTISNEQVTPALYNPAAGSPSVNSPAAGSQSVTFTLGTYQNQNATITLKALNQSSVSVLRTVTIANQPPGSVTVTWDGRADNGMWVAPGFYTLILAVTDSLGNVTVQHLVTTIEY